jgi:hypothetical protein
MLWRFTVWQPVYKIETRVTVMGREPWELAILLAVLLVTNLSSREWAGAIGAVVVTVIATLIVNIALVRLKQAIPAQAMIHFWYWLLSKDVYVVEREEVCKPLLLKLPRAVRLSSRSRLEASL